MKDAEELGENPTIGRAVVRDDFLEESDIIMSNELRAEESISVSGPEGGEGCLGACSPRKCRNLDARKCHF